MTPICEPSMVQTFLLGFSSGLIFLSIAIMIVVVVGKK